MADKKESVAGAVRRLLARDLEISNRRVVEATGLSRQAVHQGLSRMVATGELQAIGAGRSTRYRRPPPSTRSEPSSVFVVHGRDEQAREALFHFLRAIGVRPLEWSHAVRLTQHPMPYVGDVLDAAFSNAQAIVVLLTPDDEGRLRKSFRQKFDPVHETDLAPQARQNVLFEAGMAMGRSPDRTILVEVGRLRPFSDIAGRHVVRMGGSLADRQELAQRLRAAGCRVDLDGTDWHTAGDFVVDDSEEEASDPVDRATTHGADDASFTESPPSDESDEEETGYLEKMADMEEAFPRLVGTLGDITALTEEVGEAASAASQRIESANRSGAGTRAKLAIAIRLGEELDPHAARYEHLADSYSQQVGLVNEGMHALFRALRDDHQQRSAESPITFLANISAMGSAAKEAMASVEYMEQSLEYAGRFAAPLRKRTNRIRDSLRKIIEASRVMDSWEREASELLQKKESLPTDPNASPTKERARP